MTGQGADAFCSHAYEARQTHMRQKFCPRSAASYESVALAEPKFQWSRGPKGLWERNWLGRSAFKSAGAWCWYHLEKQQLLAEVERASRLREISEPAEAVCRGVSRRRVSEIVARCID